MIKYFKSLIFRYSFSCKMRLSMNAITTLNTDWQPWVDWISNPWHSGNIVFLGYHPVSCLSSLGYIVSFQVQVSLVICERWRL